MTKKEVTSTFSGDDLQDTIIDLKSYAFSWDRDFSEKHTQTSCSE